MAPGAIEAGVQGAGVLHELFVPGRLCLLGEHTDWSAGYRASTPAIPVGRAIVTGTTQGLYATARTLAVPMLVYKTHLGAGPAEAMRTFELDMDLEKLKQEAESGSLVSYVAGVAYQVLLRFGPVVRGLEIVNYKTTLPIKKGLSSSAAVCVLVARSFSRVYDLQLPVDQEMDLAFLGETTTPSRCGRLDQACAYGTRPILMTFDGGHISVEAISLPCPFYFVVVDLGAFKDTKRILKELNDCYPVARTPVHEAVQHYLGYLSPSATMKVVWAMEEGKPSVVGSLMASTQREFDEALIPACPSQLTAPILHQLLTHPPLQDLIWGGKGVGSQGDGTAQFLAKDAEAQHALVGLIERDFPQMHCLALTLPPTLPLSSYTKG